MSNKKKTILMLLLIALLLLPTQNINIKKYLPKEKEIVKITKDNQPTKKSNKVQELRTTYNNNDIIGNIAIENTTINEPILQSTDNDYYLVHDNYGNYDKYGSIFLDYRCHKNTKKLLIFGHSSTRINTTFNQLENYYQKDYYKEHSKIILTIDDEERIYQIFSVYIEPEDFTYMNLNLTEEEYISDLKKYKNNSLYETNVPIYPSDEIVILQTCSNHPDYQQYKDKFLLIIAKKI